MKLDVDIKALLSAVDVPADWVGLREVYEAHTPRMIRDGVPVVNASASTHGIMVEVLVNGQFGYFGTPDMTSQGISRAAKKAFKQAEIASRHSVHSFDESARPSHQGSYSSPFEKDRDSLSAGRLNEVLLEAYNHLKVNDKIVSASSLCQVIESNFKFVSSNGSDINQDFFV